MEKTRFIYEDATLTVKILGDIDHHNARAVREEADKIILGRKPRLILLDLSAVEFMDSSGIAVAINALRSMTSIQGRLELTGLNPQPLKVFRASGIDKLIHIKEMVL